MQVLTVFAHPGRRSFCHAVLERFDAGLREAGHQNEIVDLYAIGFDPVLRDRDLPSWMDPEAPDEVIQGMQLEARMLEEARGPIARFLTRRLIGKRDTRSLIRLLRERFRPADVLEQQRKVARAQALAFVAPVWFVGFPAILKGWIERVFTLGFAFGVNAQAWRGDIGGRTPLLRHQKALVLQTTIFDERSYREAGLAEAMRLLLCDFGLRYPGVKEVQHVLLHAVYGADEAARRAYLERAHRLGREF